MTGTEVGISLAIAAGVFAIIIFNIVRVSSSESDNGSDQSGGMLLQNVLIAIAGCAALLWYWGYFDESDRAQPGIGTSSPRAGVEGPAHECSNPNFRREMQALRYCINSDSCANTATDIEKILAFQEACPRPPPTPEQRYPGGCDIYNPLAESYMHLESADCVEFFDSMRQTSLRYVREAADRVS